MSTLSLRRTDLETKQLQRTQFRHILTDKKIIQPITPNHLK